MNARGGTAFRRRGFDPRPGNWFFSFLKAFLTISENTIEFSEFFNEFKPIFADFSTNFLKKINKKNFEKARYKRVWGAL